MAASRPLVHVIATGGSISGLGPHRLDYTLYPELGKRLTVRRGNARAHAGSERDRRGEGREPAPGGQLVDRTGGVAAARSTYRRAPEQRAAAEGVVITHGTATLEETGYFLHLTVKSDRPVVMTGAMRPPSALGTDADLNLMDAIRLAACPDAAGRGVLTDPQQRDPERARRHQDQCLPREHVRQPRLRLLGYVDADGRVLFYRDVTRLHTSATPFDVRGRRRCLASTSCTPMPAPTAC